MKPQQSYLICTTPRSGSTLLSTILVQSKLAGQPWEWFNQNAYSRLFEEAGVSNFEDYLQTVLETRTSPNGIFGVKVMIDQLYHFFGAVRELPAYRSNNIPLPKILEEVLPNLRYIWLTRRDKVRQAISLEKARQTGIWRSHSNLFELTGKEPVFNYEAINHWLESIVRQETLWQEYFTKHGITPLTLVYEDFYPFPEETIQLVFGYLQIPVPPDLQVNVADKKLADSTSEMWVQQYLQTLNTKLTNTAKILQEGLGGGVGSNQLDKLASSPKNELVYHQIVQDLSGEEMAQLISTRRIIQAIVFKAERQPVLGWLYKFRRSGRKT